MDFVKLFFTIYKWFFTNKDKRSTGTNYEVMQRMKNLGASSNLIQAGDHATVIVNGKIPFEEHENTLYYRNSEGTHIPVTTGFRIWSGRQAEYNAINPKRDDTLYLVHSDND